MKDIDKYIKKYENEIKELPVENVYVIHKDGSVLRYIGDIQSVSFLTNDLKGARITHNHPVIEGEPSNSFQKDDFSFLQGHGFEIKQLWATYGNMRYEAHVLKDLSDVSYDSMMMKVNKNGDSFLNFIDFADLVFVLLDQGGYLKYAKTKIE